MNWVLRILSFVALLAIFSELASQGSFIGVLGSFAAGTAADLALSVGVVALVDAAQRRRWSWFARLIAAVLVTVYGPFVIYTVLPYSGIHFVGAFTFVYTFIYLMAQAVTPLVALLYTLPHNQIRYV